MKGTPDANPEVSAALEILVLNKTDLGVHPLWRETAHVLAVRISCQTGDGFNALEEAVYRRVTRGDFFFY